MDAYFLVMLITTVFPDTLLLVADNALLKMSFFSSYFYW